MITKLKLLHCLYMFFRGESDAADEPFRIWYGKLGEVRSLIECPVLLITATANNASRKEMMKKFCMKNPLELVHNPDRENIKLFLHKFKSTVPLADLFYFLTEMLKEKQQLSTRFLIFCTSIKACSDIFTMFRMELSHSIKYVEMYHSKTPETIKDNIKSDMNDAAGRIRILVATSAAGMGVNFKGVDNVINFGPPKVMDDFVQQFGRAGREGNTTAMALLIYNGKQCKKLDGDMKLYIDNTKSCRREILLNAYKSTPVPERKRHLCCDICAENCGCGEDDCSQFEHPYFKVSLPVFSSESESELDFSDGFSEESV